MATTSRALRYQDKGRDGPAGAGPFRVALLRRLESPHRHASIRSVRLGGGPQAPRLPTVHASGYFDPAAAQCSLHQDTKSSAAHSSQAALIAVQSDIRAT